MHQFARALVTAVVFASAVPAVAQEPKSGGEQGPPVIKIDRHEWGLGLDGRATVPGNEARFEIRNSGSTAHSFEIEGEIAGKEVEVVSARLEPGQNTTFTVHLPAGEYTAYCPVGNHKDRGMAAKIVFKGGS